METDSGARPDSNADENEQALRRRVIAADADRVSPYRDGVLWNELRAGNWLVVDEFSANERSYLVLARRANRAKALRSKHWVILERVLLGESQKVIAIDLDLSASTVATVSKTALGAIGVTSRASCVPPLLCMLANAAFRSGAPSFRTTTFEVCGVRYCALSAAFKRSTFSNSLSPAEQTVALMRLQGRSLAEIATTRNTSLRTVANQVSTAFKRLGVSGRPSLIQYVLKSPHDGVE